VTTQSVGDVAANTVDAALKGRTVVIPGFVNQVVQVLGALVPTSLAGALDRQPVEESTLRTEGGSEARKAGAGYLGVF
jgi:hypothetical protein